MAAKLLIEQGHEVVLHGRNEGRSRDALAAALGARGSVSGVNPAATILVRASGLRQMI